MPVSGPEETEVKSYAGQFSGLIAGVPIKKRRFPLVQPFSPLSGEQYSLTEETESLRKEHSSTPQESTLSNAGIADAPIKKRRFPLIQASSSSLEEPSSLPEENSAFRKEHSSTALGSTLAPISAGLSDTKENPAFVERKAGSDVTKTNFVQSKSSYLRPKLEEPDLATRSSTLDVVDSKEKLITSGSYEDKLGPQMMKENSELLLAAKQSLALNIGAEISMQNVEEKCKQESRTVPESTSLSLGFKQHLFPAVTSLDFGESFRKTEKAESVSLKLSLSKDEGSSKSHNDDAKTNRANWDLNTTMDAWEEPGSDATSGKTSVGGLQMTGSALNEKHIMCSTGMEATGSTSLMQTSMESQNKAFQISPRLYGPQNKYVDPRNLYLASGLQKYTAESSRLSVKQNSDCAIPTLNLSNVPASSSDVNIASIMTVKSEPLDENRKRDLKEAKPSSVGSLDVVTVKPEFVERSNVELVKSSEASNKKIHIPKFIKSETGDENNQERSESISDQMGKELLRGSDNCSSLEKPVSLESVPLSAGTASSPVKAICSVELSTSVSIVSHPENRASIEGACVDGKASLADCSVDKQVSPEIVSIATADNAESSGPGKKNSVINEENADDVKGCRLKLMNELPLDPQSGGEDGVSDDDKITLSTDMVEDDTYVYDYESDGTHSLTVAMDIEQYGEEDDDYEDGEVREPLKHPVAEDSICEVREVERVVSSNYCGKQIQKEVSSVDCSTSSHVEENGIKNVTHSEINCGNDGIDIESIHKSDNVTGKSLCLPESLEAEKPIVGSQMRLLDISKRQNNIDATETELLSDQGNNESHEVDATQCADEVVKNLDMARKTDSELPKMEVSVNTDDASKDVSNGGNQGRIINLSRASSLSPTKSRSIPGRGLPSRGGRDVLSESFHDDKLHGGRDDFYIDGPCKFSRERFQDISPRNSRLNFVRGRGRFNGRIGSRGGEWESDCEFSDEFYSGPSQYRGPRHKFASAVHDTDSEYNNVAHDGPFVCTNRLGRRPLNDEGPVGRHITLRRRSPGGRESMQMGHRIPRTMSPSRCVGDDGSDFVSMRHGEKFMRGYPQDPPDPMFRRPQPFERRDGRFTRGTRNFFQRRGPHQIHSKSPIRSRSRSPGPWSSPRRSPRRSPNTFGGHPLYRVDRVRSPDHPVFHGERVVRRHVSPSYMSRPSNGIRDIGSRRGRGRGRGRGHPRSVISNRRPSGRIFLRNRRFDVDAQDRADNDEYFEGPMHSGRLLELDDEGNGDEKRRFGERRGPVRSFRPSFNDSVGENFHLDAEDGPRQYRFCPEDSEFQDRNNLRERDFDRRIKGRPANVPPRRTRNIDEQEANYRNSGHVWSDEGFDDISRVKRKRF